MTETETVRNGIDVGQLPATIDAIKDHPEYRRSSSATCSSTKTTGHYLESTYDAGALHRVRCSTSTRILLT
jgi:hypothetical protein